MGFKIKLKYYSNKLRFYLSFLLLVFYTVISYMFLFTDVWADLLPKGRNVVGIVLFLFGILRFYIAYRRYINKSIKIKSLTEIKANVAED